MSNNLPMIPGGAPSAAEVNEMKRLMQITAGQSQQGYYSGGSEGRRAPINESVPRPPVYMSGGSPSSEDVAQMKTLLERLHSINGTNAPEPTPSAPAAGTRAAGAGYKVTSILSESTGKPTSFNVVDGNGQEVTSGLVVSEAAQAVSKFLNKGLTLHDSKVAEVLALEEEYNSCRIEAGILRGRFDRAKQIGESEAADVFKSRHAKVKATAIATHDRLKSILAAIR